MSITIHRFGELSARPPCSCRWVVVVVFCFVWLVMLGHASLSADLPSPTGAISVNHSLVESGCWSQRQCQWDIPIDTCEAWARWIILGPPTERSPLAASTWSTKRQTRAHTWSVTLLTCCKILCRFLAMIVHSRLQQKAILYALMTPRFRAVN